MKQIIPILQLGEEALDELDINALAARMDEILRTAQLEIQGKDVAEHMPRTTVKSVIETPMVQQRPTETQRRIAYRAFECLLQIEYTQVAAAAQNRLVYDYDCTEEQRWSSPSMQIRQAALQQWIIVSSRMVMESFMQMLHVIGTGERIRASRSTVKSFKKWLLEPANPFAFFAQHVLKALEFDRQHRSPEVHAFSKFPRTILLMKDVGPEQRNKSLLLVNEMLNIWCSLLQVLNKQRATSISGGSDSREWLIAYLEDEEHFQELLINAIRGEC